MRCWVCQAEHTAENCAKLQSWKVSKRYGFCKQEGTCFRCLAGKHRGVNCRRFPGCEVEGCGGTHHSLLHASNGAEQSQYRATEANRRPDRSKQMNLEAKEFKPRNNQTFSNETSRNMPENKQAPGTSEPPRGVSGS